MVRFAFARIHCRTDAALFVCFSSPFFFFFNCSIAAIQFKLVDAQLDQLKQVVRITRTTYRAFGAPEWSKLGARLAEWSQSVTEVLAVVRNARLISAQTTA